MNETPQRIGLPATVGEWEHFSHDADIGVRGRGPDKETAFSQAALALTAIVTDPIRVRDIHQVELSCDATDDELLLARFLNDVIFEMATRAMVFGSYRVRMQNHRLLATAWGERVDPVRHSPAVEPKGATLTQIRVARTATGWIAQCVIDV